MIKKKENPKELCALIWNQKKKKKDEDIDVFIYCKQKQKKNPYDKESVPIKHNVK